MEALVKLADMLKTGGGWGVAALMFGMWFLQRKDYLALQKDLFGLAQTVAAASAKSESAVNSLRDLLLHRWQ